MLEKNRTHGGWSLAWPDEHAGWDLPTTPGIFLQWLPEQPRGVRAGAAAGAKADQVDTQNGTFPYLNGLIHLSDSRSLPCRRWVCVCVFVSHVLHFIALHFMSCS